MGELGDLLELMHTASRRYRTVRATFREWRDETLVKRIEERVGGGEDAENRRSAKGKHEVLTRLSFAKPDRLRIERETTDGDLAVLVVLDGRRRYSYVADWGTEVEDQKQGDAPWVLGSAADLLNPAPLLASLDLDAPRRDEVAGRAVLRARARERGRLAWPFGPADEHELCVDAERGVVLRLSGLVDKEPARVHELLQPVFDSDFPPGTFEFEVPEDGEISGLAPQDVARLATFTIWALPGLAQQITYRPPDPRRGRVESVTIEYAESMLVQVSADDGAVVGWTSYEPPQRVEQDGRSYWVANGQLWFAAGDTFVSLSAPGVAPNELIGLAESLVRVEGGPKTS